jgi:plastocyanin
MIRRVALPAAALAGLAVAVVPALAADQTVRATMDDKFSPETVTVAAGEKVTIVNENQGFHDLKWNDRPQREFAAGANWTSERAFTAADDGKVFRYVCQIHSDGSSTGMVGRVVVGSGSAGTAPPTQTGTGSTPPPAPGGTRTRPRDTRAPRLTRPVARATRSGVTVTLRLSEPASVSVNVTRRGRRVVLRTFRVRRSGRATLRIRRRLATGALVVRVRAIDASGNRSPTRTLRPRVS